MRDIETTEKMFSVFSSDEEIVEEFASINLNDSEYESFQGLFINDKLRFLIKTFGFNSLIERIRVLSLELNLV